MRYAQFTIIILASLVILFGCKKTPTDSGDTEAPQVTGSYVGWGMPGGTGFNMRIEIEEADSANWDGTILYAGSTVPLTITSVSENEDSIRFEFTRASTYRYLGILSNVSMTIMVLEPAGQPTYFLNRERNGYNLSGDWDGWMYSQFLNTTEDAEMFMNHQGTLFDGDVESSFGFYNLLGDVTSGAQNGAGVSFWGTAPFDGGEYPFQFDGTFINRDSVNGSWQLSVSGGGDSGTFAFARRF